MKQKTALFDISFCIYSMTTQIDADQVDPMGILSCLHLQPVEIVPTIQSFLTVLSEMSPPF